MRPALGASILALGLATAFAVGCGDDDKEKDKAQTTTARTTPRTTSTTANRTRTTSTNDQGGAQVEAGPGSASVQPTGAVGTAGIGSVSSTSGVIRPFSADSPWNTQVFGSPVDANSDRYMRLVQRRIGVVEDGAGAAGNGRTPVLSDGTPVSTSADGDLERDTRTGGETRTVPRVVTDGLFVNTRKWTTPIVDEEGGEATRVACRQLPPYCGDGANIESLIIPPGESPLPQYDGWFTVLNRGEGVAYDLWRARRARGGGNVISYQFMRKWDLNGPGFLEPNTVSARGSGLPLFAGVILPEEIQACRIDHALAISLPGPAQRNYVQPASATDGVGDTRSLPEGARIRLKAGVTLPKLRQRTNRCAAEAIYTALRRYGAIVVDRSAIPTLYAKLNFNWNQVLRGRDGQLLDGLTRKRLNRFVRRLPNQGTPLLRGNEVQGLKMEDFEVVQIRGELLKFPNLAATRGQSPGAPTGGQRTRGATTTTPARTTPAASQTFGPSTTTTPAPTTTTGSGG